MTSEPAAADYFTTGAFMQKKHGGRLNLRYSEGNISCRTLPIVERKAALDTQGHMRSPDIEYFTAERPDFSSQYHFNKWCAHEFSSWMTFLLSYPSHCIAEMSPVCAIVGGIVGQEVVKV